MPERVPLLEVGKLLAGLDDLKANIRERLALGRRQYVHVSAWWLLENIGPGRLMSFPEPVVSTQLLPLLAQLD